MRVEPRHIVRRNLEIENAHGAELEHLSVMRLLMNGDNPGFSSGLCRRHWGRRWRGLLRRDQGDAESKP